MMDADKTKVESIQTKADATASKEKEAQIALDAQKARSGEAVIHMGNPVHHLTDEEKAYYGLDKNDITFKDASSYYIRNRYKNKGKADELMLTMGVKMNNALKVDFNQNDDNRKVDIDHLTDAEIIEISDFYAKLINALQEKMGYPTTYRAYVAQDTLEHSKKMAKAYEARGTDPSVAGHITENNGTENLATVSGNSATTMLDLKYNVLNAFKEYSFLDDESNWGHAFNNLSGGGVAMTVANINGRRWFVNSFGSDGKHKINLNQDLAQLEAKLAEAQKQNSQAQTALTNAKAELAAASRKYASALEAKTDAEKELASKSETPLQTEVAEKNLQLANLALTNAQERKANAEKAVENFSRSQAEKETALETTKVELATAKTAQKDAETALTNAQAKLQAEENKLTVLQAEQEKLHEEKDKLVSNAKAIATELSAYLNADKNLADAQAKVADLETKLTQAKSTAKLAQDKLDVVTAKLKTEKAKLAEIQDEFDKLVKAERKDYYNLSDWYLEYLAGKQADKKTDTKLKKVEDSKASQAGNWIESAGRWWYKHADGSYTTNGWEQIKGTWYYFDHAGWMQTGWVKTGGTWYYLNETGSLATGWVKDNGTWYYLNKSGSLATGWVKDNGSWYYLDKSGAMKTGWFTVSGKWYYAYNSGALAVNTTTPDGYEVNANGVGMRCCGGHLILNTSQKTHQYMKNRDSILSF